MILLLLYIIYLSGSFVLYLLNLIFLIISLVLLVFRILIFLGFRMSLELNIFNILNIFPKSKNL